MAKTKGGSMQSVRGIIAGLVLAPGLALCLSTNADAQTAKVDNTVQNMRDRDVNNPTPQDQSNRKADIKVTAKLRRAVVHERGLSMNAKNIKIITQKGCVVLRGPVNSDYEKQVIDRLAQQYCGTNYVNELEVKSR
jgi:hyperosmotically inducible periplasmic protein